ncbi:haloacid dehalogenase superfamily protein [Aspergillus saccharolyticus JOP 1030-1]|uniref:HAD superfamily hydrolase n=1 Tax=Aspergillus saccharolyticus JOP 1030-1 TaxID=1450539 RepID=A0A318Z4S0_9EURO|nr:HAD superfamily hydrolase [Aspergillus saccharolyticus JOP 1030-1]PYH42311.1 HAD superfamily hydrolase [Aspergillus saccharolyticus JOP 1030-1]
MSPSTPELPRVRACLFDMDGLLIDSEDIYTSITNTILQEYGKPMLPWSIKAQLQGRPAPEASRIFHTWANLPIPLEEYATKLTTLQQTRFPETQPLPGVLRLLEDLRSTHSTPHPVHLALATSSHSKNFQLKSSHLPHLFAAFPKNQQVLGDDPRIGSGRGKPLPDIYLLALETINQGLREKGEEEIKPEECLVFEDAVPGVEAGRRAGMRVVWVPHPGLREEYRGREEEVLAGLTGEHKEEEKGKMERVAEGLVAGREGREGDNGDGRPGSLGDGWGVLLDSLEGFPYERFGIVPASSVKEE